MAATHAQQSSTGDITKIVVMINKTGGWRVQYYSNNEVYDHEVYSTKAAAVASARREGKPLGIIVKIKGY